MQEISVGGIFIPAVLVWAGAAFVAASWVAKLLSWVGAYRVIWHRALFDFCVFVVLWGIFAAIPYHLAFADQ